MRGQTALPHTTVPAYCPEWPAFFRGFTFDSDLLFSFLPLDFLVAIFSPVSAGMNCSQLLSIGAGPVLLGGLILIRFQDISQGNGFKNWQQRSEQGTRVDGSN